ncbi:MAG: hypothetical protein AAF149_07240 [Bacteroidota bacterium]
MKKGMILILITVFGCDINADKKVTLDNFEFKTGDDTELFFKNVRQSYYDLEENQAAKFNLFRFSDRVVSDSLPILNLAIVINYLQDEAYLFLEPNEILAAYEPLILSWENDTDGTKGQYMLQAMNRDSMLSFSTKIYNSLMTNHELALTDGTAILSSKKQREAFRITMADYFRLTRLD